MKKIVNALRKLLVIFNKKQRFGFLSILIATFFAAALETVGVSLIIPLIDVMYQPDDLLNGKIGQIVTSLLGNISGRELATIILLSTIVFYCLKNLYFSVFSWLKISFSCRIERELSTYMLQSYMNRGYSFFLNNNTNYIIRGVGDDIYKVYEIVNSLLFIITKIAIIGFIGVFMIVTDWKLAVVMLASAVLCICVVFFLFKKRLKRAGILEREANWKTGQSLIQIIQGIKEVLVFRKQKSMLKMYDGYKKDSKEQQIKRQMGNELPVYIIETIFVVFLLLTLSIRMMSENGNSDYIAVLAAFAVGAFRILPALSNISISLNNITANIPSLNAVYENIIEARNSNDVYQNVDVEDNTEFGDLKFTSSIDILDVHFAYSDNREVLRGVTMHIGKGESVGIVGSSGAGKSTLADIILGILSPNKGDIMLDGYPIKEMPNYWSKTIGFVPQSIYLSDMTVRENVAFGVMEEDIDDKLVVEALTRASIYDFVNTLPNGIYSEIGERGTRLSGGQRQRIGIARALYHKPEILILDEATSALDNETEHSVMEAIDTLQGSVTMIIIAHRLATIKKCTKIYELVNGIAVKREYEELL